MVVAAAYALRGLTCANPPDHKAAASPRVKSA